MANNSDPETKQSAVEPHVKVFNIGDVVTARWRNNKNWYRATVIAINSAGRFDIIFDDGIEEKSVHPKNMHQIRNNVPSVSVSRRGTRSRHPAENRFMEIHGLKHCRNIHKCFRLGKGCMCPSDEASKSFQDSEGAFSSQKRMQETQQAFPNKRFAGDMPQDNDFEKQQLFKLMTELCKEDVDDYFGEPVDTFAWQIPDYPEIIKNPMDFGTIKKKLKENCYHSRQDFVNDIELTFNNSLLYNWRETCPVRQATLRLQKTFWTLYSGFLQEVERPSQKGTAQNAICIGSDDEDDDYHLDETKECNALEKLKVLKEFLTKADIGNYTDFFIHEMKVSAIEDFTKMDSTQWISISNHLLAVPYRRLRRYLTKQFGDTVIEHQSPESQSTVANNSSISGTMQAQIKGHNESGGSTDYPHMTASNVPLPFGCVANQVLLAGATTPLSQAEPQSAQPSAGTVSKAAPTPDVKDLDEHTAIIAIRHIVTTCDISKGLSNFLDLLSEKLGVSMAPHCEWVKSVLRDFLKMDADLNSNLSAKNTETSGQEKYVHCNESTPSSIMPYNAFISEKMKEDTPGTLVSGIQDQTSVDEEECQLQLSNQISLVESSLPSQAKNIPQQSVVNVIMDREEQSGEQQITQAEPLSSLMYRLHRSQYTSFLNSKFGITQSGEFKFLNHGDWKEIEAELKRAGCATLRDELRRIGVQICDF